MARRINIKIFISKSTFVVLLNIIITQSSQNINKNYNEIGVGGNHINQQQKDPYFETHQNLNMTAMENESVVLKCAVKNKGNRTISWIRKTDLHILTSENFVFSSDQRFTVLHDKNLNEWNLKIDRVTTNDSGFYECQLNTQPKIKISIFLEVEGVPEIIEEGIIAPVNSFDGKVKYAQIFGPPVVHVRLGSTISLTCIINHHVPTIQWFHNSHAIEFNTNRGGINLETEKNPDGMTSRLLLTRAQYRDGGNYSCVPHGAISASCVVHILNGEHPAERYTSGSVSCFKFKQFLLTFSSGSTAIKFLEYFYFYLFR